MFSFDPLKIPTEQQQQQFMNIMILSCLHSHSGIEAEALSLDQNCRHSAEYLSMETKRWVWAAGPLDRHILGT